MLFQQEDGRHCECGRFDPQNARSERDRAGSRLHHFVAFHFGEAPFRPDDEQHALVFLPHIRKVRERVSREIGQEGGSTSAPIR